MDAGWNLERTDHGAFVSGEIDIGVADDLREALGRATHGAAGPLLFDLSQVTFMDSAGIRALILLSMSRPRSTS